MKLINFINEAFAMRTFDTFLKRMQEHEHQLLNVCLTSHLQREPMAKDWKNTRMILIFVNNQPVTEIRFNGELIGELTCELPSSPDYQGTVTLRTYPSNQLTTKTIQNEN